MPATANIRQMNTTERSRRRGSIFFISYAPLGSNRAKSLSTCTSTLFRISRGRDRSLAWWLLFITAEHSMRGCFCVVSVEGSSRRYPTLPPSGSSIRNCAPFDSMSVEGTLIEIGDFASKCALFAQQMRTLCVLDLC